MSSLLDAEHVRKCVAEAKEAWDRWIKEEGGSVVASAASKLETPASYAFSYLETHLSQGGRHHGGAALHGLSDG